jgi:GTP-binding protein YchF
MNISCGIVGLPNVGKSTLFNALLKKQQALAANYPFATIEPNVGIVPVPDERLLKLAEITREEVKMNELPPLKPATVEFLDIAGLVKGASEGAGLGNKFLSHIREVSVICHVVRAFSDDNIIREGSIDPKSDYETIETELILADLQTIQNVQSKTKRFADVDEKSAVEKLFQTLNEGKAARTVSLSDEELVFARQWSLLSMKKEIIVLNVSESDYSEEKIGEVIAKYAGLLGVDSHLLTVVCAKVEEELSQLAEEEQKEYLAGLGVLQSGLERVIQKAYETLGLISFLTCGEKEVRAWTIKKGIDAQHAAGEIHTDFIKKFIKAEVVSYADFVEFHGWKGAREHGKARQEGRDYIMKDGDVVEFKIGS